MKDQGMFVRHDQVKSMMRILLALFFVVAGAAHFLKTSLYMQIVPPFLPRPRELVLISGACEIMGGVGLLVPRLRRIAGYGLIALLIAVFPANIYMAVNNISVAGASISSALLWLRLPLQFALIAWVWWCAKD
jgi:uncharacterized membrane protein